MPQIELGDVTLHWREAGDPAGAPVVFHHEMGTDLGLWAAVLPLLPPGLRLVSFDMRGHGGSSVPPAPYGMGTLIRDAERLMDGLGLRDAVFVGLGLGGLVAQGLAVKRLDLVRAMVLANSAVKIGTPATWARTIAALEAGGAAPWARETLPRWFSRRFLSAPETAGLAQHWQAVMAETPLDGLTGAAAAIAGTDFITPTAGLTLPVLVLSGLHDAAIPPDMVRETAGLMLGARHEMLRAGHLAPVDAPEAFAAALGDFLQAIGQAPARRPAAGPAHHDHHDHEHGPDCGCGPAARR